MTFWSATCRAMILLSVCLGLNGCFPPTENSLDEEKNPHFLAGKAKVSSLDYSGAVEAFDKAVEANPHSASAHKELGLLFFQRIKDPAAAIYHFEKLLKLRPTDPHADTVRQFIVDCKQELARSVSLGPVTKQVQDELVRLTAENADQRRQIEFLRAQLAQRPLVVTNSPIVSTPTPVASVIQKPQTLSQAVPQFKPVADNPHPAPASVAAPKKHVIRPRETYIIIAAKYGMKPDALKAANPGVDPRKLKVGQIINLPSR